jgi:tRNA (guanosine-2'-O-)-methyltransferase
MFPFRREIFLNSQYSVPFQVVLERVWPLLTEERRQKIERVVKGRCFSNVVVLEDIYDRGNVSAVVRSAEALGFSQVHLIELGEKFKESQRTTAGADKWIEMKRWKNRSDCIRQLKSEGKQIVVTHLDVSSKPISAVDFSKPSALVLGNEKEGVSPEMIDAADHRVIIPMEGFVQSYNISVAGALCFYQMYLSRVASLGRSGELSLEEQEILKAVYATRTLDSSEDVLRRYHDTTK